MATQAATLGRIIRTAASQDRSPATDRELLHRFADAGDQDAFAVLVRRHTGLVLSVCRRALPTEQDAEDVCQATFLILARKAAAGRWQPSIANWLYTTARRVAGHQRRAAVRRARREGKAAVPESVQPVDRMTGRELLGVIDEELDRLPSIYREPLLLFYQEGLGREEIAGRLGVPATTVKTQLERGRRRLCNALTRRGVALGSGLLACAITSRAGAVPARVLSAVLDSVRGTPPPAVAELCRGVVMNGTGTKVLFLAAVIVGVAVLGVGAVSPIAGEQKPDPPIAKKAEPGDKLPPVKAAPPARTYAGKVIDPDGKPVKGAAVFAFEADGPGRDPQIVRATAGDDGQFRIALPADKRFTRGLFATAAGFGIGRVEPKGDTADELTIRLVADNPVAGRVVTTEGKPVAGVRLTIDRIADDVDDLDQVLAKLKAGGERDGLGHRRSMPTNREELGTTTVTGADGKFRLTGGGNDRILYVDVRGDGIAAARLIIVNRPGFDPEPYNAALRKAGDRFERRSVLHGPTLGLVAEREQLIRGRVTDAATGEPRPGVHVLLTRSRSDLLLPILDAWTDKDGRYEIRGARKASGYMVEVVADTAAGYMPSQAWADDTIGYEPVTIDLHVKKGVIVTGRMIDKGTGKPLVGFAMIGVPQGNPSVKDYPAFEQSAWFPVQDTDGEGRFRVVAIPGPVLLMGGPRTWDEMAKYKPPVADPKYPQFFQKFADHTAFLMSGGTISPLQGRFCKVLDIKADAKVVEQDIVLEPVEPPKKAEKKP
jgi:RNA polymerase sigma factor (sigma-70 family)